MTPMHCDVIHVAYGTQHALALAVLYAVDGSSAETRCVKCFLANPW